MGDLAGAFNARGWLVRITYRQHKTPVLVAVGTDDAASAGQAAAYAISAGRRSDEEKRQMDKNAVTFGPVQQVEVFRDTLENRSKVFTDRPIHPSSFVPPRRTEKVAA